MMLERLMLLGRLMLEPLRMMLMHPRMAIGDPPVSIMPDMTFVVVA